MPANRRRAGTDRGYPGAASSDSFLLRSIHDDVRAKAVECAASDARNGEEIFRATDGSALLAEADDLRRGGGPDAGQLLEFLGARPVQVHRMVGMFAEPAGNGVAQIAERLGNAAGEPGLQPEREAKVQGDSGEDGNQAGSSARRGSRPARRLPRSASGIASRLRGPGGRRLTGGLTPRRGVFRGHQTPGRRRTGAPALRSCPRRRRGRSECSRSRNGSGPRRARRPR